MEYDDRIVVDEVATPRTVTVNRKDVKLAADGVGNGTQIMLTGRCNSYSDWRILTGATALKLGINVVYSMAAAGDDFDFDPIAGAAGLVESATWDGTGIVTLDAPLTYEFEPVVGFTGAGTTPRAATYAAEIGETITIPFNFGTDSIPAGFPAIYLIAPEMDATHFFTINVAGGYISFDTTIWEPRTFEYSIWFQFADTLDFFALTFELSEP
jgi:hypothetical protein